MKSNIFYNPDRVISYNAIFNFILGERGVGKSYSMTKFMLSDWKKHGHQFVYVRRFETDLELCVPSFWDKMVEDNVFPEDTLTVSKSNKKITKFMCNNKVCGYAIALSTASKFKSSNFSQVKNIVFDEFLLENNGTQHYLKNECEAFLGLYETIMRLRDGRAFFLGNSTSITNPYFAYFDLTLPYGKDIATFKSGTMLVNYIKNEPYREVKKQSRFGQMVNGTHYAEYAIDNKMLMDNNGFIEKKTRASKDLATIKLNGKYYGLWRDFEKNMIFISSSYDPNNPNVFALDVKDHTENTQLTSLRKSTWFKLVIDSFRLGVLFFETQRIKNEFMEILTNCF